MDAVTIVRAEAGSKQHGIAVVDDRLLVKRAQRGDRPAFEALYRTHVKRVYALCWRLSGDSALAEDLCQDTFVKAWTGLASFRGDSAFGTWLHRVAVNAILGQRRWSDRREDLRAEDLNSVETFSAAEPESKPTVGLDLERAIGQLPEKARAVFVLHDVEGYRHREISDLTGIAVGTSKAHLHRARKLLREALR